MVITNNNDNDTAPSTETTNWDAIIIGGGMAGLSTALTVLDAGGRVLIVEKNSHLGGNSIKASSGINAVIDTTNQDDAAAFIRDTMDSAGKGGDPVLIETLVSHSHESVVEWLQSRLHVDLSQVAQLGGHSKPRTLRPSGPLPIGAEIMIQLETAVKAFEEQGAVKICTGVNAHKLLQDDLGRVHGIVYVPTGDAAEQPQVVHAPHVVLATGGFAADRSCGSWLAKVRPDLVSLGTTAGVFSTGDGLSLATALQAKLVGMEHIQVHPTGFVDPKDPNHPNKFLAAEILRGVGGILLTPKGKRFCNELGRRDYVMEEVFSLIENNLQTKVWKGCDEKAPRMFLLLSEEGASSIQNHIDFYVLKGLLSKVKGVKEIADYMGVSEDTIRSTLREYQALAQAGVDLFGKDRFPWVPPMDNNKNTEVYYYIGKVEPVLHYCMGGVQINPQGQVLKDLGTVIPGLYACGEVAGGLHGKNRLAGNSLCECVVFGRIVGHGIVECRKAASKI